MKSINKLSLVKTVNKLSLMKSIHNLTHMKSVNNLSLVKTIIDRTYYSACYIGRQYSSAFVVQGAAEWAPIFQRVIKKNETSYRKNLYIFEKYLQSSFPH